MLRHIFRTSAAVAAFHFAWCANAHGQGVDPNIQTRIENVEPPPRAAIIPSRTREEPIYATIPERTMEVFVMGEKRITTIPAKRVQVGVKTVSEPRPVTVTFTLPSRYDYVSNVFSTRSDHRADLVRIAVPRLEIKIPVGPADDTISLITQASMVRYGEFERRDGESLTGKLGYARVLSKGGLNWSDVPSKSRALEILSFTHTESAGFERGFTRNTAHFSTPTVSWGFDNIPIGSMLCGGSHCLLGGFSLELGHSWSDAPILDNTAATFLTQVGWTLPRKWSWNGSASVTGKLFDRYPGGREDIYVSLNTGLAWKPNDSMSLSAGFEYARQFSSQYALNFDGFRVQPQVRMSFKLQ